MLHSNYITPLMKYKHHHRNKRKVLQLVFGKECNECEARYGHHIFSPLMKRLCPWCIHDALISNRVLLHKYGIHFADILKNYHQKEGTLIVFNSKRNQKIQPGLLELTSEAVDLNKHSIVQVLLFYFAYEKSVPSFMDVCMYREIKETNWSFSVSMN